MTGEAASPSLLIANKSYMSERAVNGKGGIGNQYDYFY
jgi:hypothetical protein